MKKMSRLALIVLAVASVAPVALADLAKPQPRPHRKQKTRDSALLVISAVAVVGLSATTALADLAPGPFGGGGSIVNVIVAGFFLAASIAFGGIWLARYRRREGPKRKAVLVVVLVFVGLVAVLALADLVFVVAADARVPDRFPLSAGTLTRAIPNGEALSGEVRIRITDEGDQITLTLPKPK
jgi:MFS family permease